MARSSEDWLDLGRPEGVGTATPASGDAASETGYAVAHLWLPDPSERRGWLLRRVDRPQRPTPARPMGFRH